MNESAVQRKIIERHTKKGWMCVKVLQCTVNGFPDLMLLRGGRAVFIEVKRPGVKTADPLQVYRHGQLRDLGFECHLTDNPMFEVLENRVPVAVSRVGVNPDVTRGTLIDWEFGEAHMKVTPALGQFVNVFFKEVTPAVTPAKAVVPKMKAVSKPKTKKP